MDAGTLRRLGHSAARRAPVLWNARTRSLLPQRLAGGIHDEDLRALGLDTMQRPVVIDVGANIGQTLVSVRRLNRSAQVTCIEPLPFALPTLIRTAERLDASVIPAAASSKTGDLLTLYVPVVGGIVFSQQASGITPDVERLAEFFRGAGFTWVTPTAISLSKQTVVTVAIDDLDLRPDVLKIDAEGLEPAILQGAQRCLETHRPVLFVETNNDDELVRETLSGYDYNRASVVGINTIYKPRPKRPSGRGRPAM